MSTLKTTNIAHPSSASNNIVLDSSGNVVLQAGSASTPALQPTGDTNTGIFFPAADTIAFAEGGSEAMRIDSSSRVLVGTSSQPNTGGTLCVNNGIGIVNNTTARFATVEHGSGASGTFTTITISATVQSSTTTVIFEALMTGFSGVYLDNVIGRYSGLPAVTMRNNASAGTSAALTVNGANTTYTLTITTSVTHPVVKVKITAGGLSSDITLPTITFA